MTHTIKHTIKKARFTRANHTAIVKARELGYMGLVDLDVRGTPEHKAVVKAAFNAQQ